MKVIAAIQARMGSTRLPGKVLKDIGSETMLARVLHRTRRAALLDEAIVATTVNPVDSAILAECARLHVPVFRGNDRDVLDRYFQAAKAYKADIVVRITSDCPLIDPEVIDRVIRVFLDMTPDYASNTLVRTYPRGLDTEVMTTAALARASSEATEFYQRAHVTPYICQNPRVFRLLSVTTDKNYSSHRWTVDTPEDLEFIRAVYARLGDDGIFDWHDVLNLLAKEPQLARLDCHIQQIPLEED